MSVITCPSGFKIDLRKLTIQEANRMASGKGKGSAMFTDILYACTERIEDVGVYTKFTGAKPRWSEVLIGDRYYAIMQLRVMTYGKDYTFRMNCREPDCRKTNRYEVDLSSLRFKPFKPEVLEKLARGQNRFEGLIPSTNTRFWHKLGTAAEEDYASKYLKEHPEKKFSAGLVSKIIEIEGVEQQARFEFIDHLYMDDVVSMIDQMDAIDGGLHTDIEVECEHCNTEAKIELPLDRYFWLPTSQR